MVGNYNTVNLFVPGHYYFTYIGTVHRAKSTAVEAWQALIACLQKLCTVSTPN